MQSFIQAKQQELTILCRRYHVRRLELFDSAAAGNCEPAASDLDFLVEFEDLDPPAYADAYFGLQESLADLYQRPDGSGHPHCGSQPLSPAQHRAKPGVVVCSLRPRSIFLSSSRLGK
jgi:predicted nucleotidyltransferase